MSARLIESACLYANDTSITIVLGIIIFCRSIHRSRQVIFFATLNKVLFRWDRCQSWENSSHTNNICYKKARSFIPIRLGVLWSLRISWFWRNHVQMNYFNGNETRISTMAKRIRSRHSDVKISGPNPPSVSQSHHLVVLCWPQPHSWKIMYSVVSLINEIKYIKRWPSLHFSRRNWTNWNISIHFCMFLSWQSIFTFVQAIFVPDCLTASTC